MSDTGPEWPRRMRALREARGLSQADACSAMQRLSAERLPTSDHLLRRWKAWEAGDNQPSRHYQPLIAAALGVSTASLFPPESISTQGSLLSGLGIDTVELLARMDASDMDRSTLDGLRITVDGLCCDYSSRPAAELIVEGRAWLRRVADLQNGRLSLRHKTESLELAGWLALLVGCLEHDLGQKGSAESTRRAALKIGESVGRPGIIGWAHEMRAWFALTSNDLMGVVAASRAGAELSGGHSVGVQLLAQEAKARARMGQVRQTQDALERGRALLETLPYPENVQNHFVVDPMKYDFYAMDCYRQSGEDRLASALAHEVIRAGTDTMGVQRSPMRIAEAQVTLGVAAARAGDLEEAIGRGDAALAIGRQSVPSLSMVGADLGREISGRYAGEPEARDFMERMRSALKPWQ